MSAEPFVSRVRLRNYKSIGACDVALGSLTLLVGRNGSGKSNFLNALAFTAEALDSSLDQALRSRGGFVEVRRRAPSKPTAVTIRLDLNLSDLRVAEYQFVLGARKGGGYGVNREDLRIAAASGRTVAEYHVKDGAVRKLWVPSAGREPGARLLTSPSEIDDRLSQVPPVAADDRLFLVRAAGFPQFREVFDSISGMSFYNLNPDHMRELQSPAPGRRLRHDGANVASVVARLEEEFPEVKERVRLYLERVVPGIEQFGRQTYGPKETLSFVQRCGGPKGAKRWEFDAGGMSDGTLRVLGILIAAMQRSGAGDPVRLVGIEEPETALHVAAAGVLFDALREAAERTQIIVTTHSPDLLDLADPTVDHLVVAQARDGATLLGEPDQVGERAIRDHLATPGDLLRMDQLRPAVDGQPELFGEG